MEDAMGTGAKRTLAMIAVCAMALGLAACRENEQDRPLAFDKGTYAGEPDQPIDEAAQENLRGRADLQGF